MTTIVETKQSLKLIQGELNNLVNEAEKRRAGFDSLANELCNKIKNNDITHANYFASVWFKCFLAHKDEAMVLFKGELIRLYHFEQHKKWIHERDKVTFNKGYQLTKCSTNGIDFEYNKLGGSSKSVSTKYMIRYI